MFNRYTLHIFRWRSSTTILVAGIASLSLFGCIRAAVIVNPVGGPIFFRIDGSIFPQKRSWLPWRIRKKTACAESNRYDLIDDLRPQYHYQPCSTAEAGQ